VQRRNFKHVPVDAKTLGDHIRLKRLEKGLTQGKVVKILRIPMKCLSDWERDLAEPSEAERSRLASLLGLDG
jgi:DNA-binding transcriptional regulator YiaG